MFHKIEWEDARLAARRGRAACNGVLLLVIVILLVVVPAARAVAPPRPDHGAVLPATLARWPSPQPGEVQRPFSVPVGDKQGPTRHHLLVIPGEFSDRAGRIKPAVLQTQFTGSIAHGSVRDYWLAASGGRLDVTATVQGRRRAPQTASYYAGTTNGMDLWGAPRNAGRFVFDVVASLDATGFDWGQFDNDGPDGIPNSGDDDGWVDGLVIVHAGVGGECGSADFWSHAYSLAGWGYGAYQTRTLRPGGGVVRVNDYILVPERSCGGDVIEIGVICHEYGHLLGLPDLYDTVGGRAGCGGWCLMGTGGWGGSGQTPAQPSLPGAWSRRELGWATVHTVRQDGAVAVPAIDRLDQVVAVRDPAMADGEVFLVENRRRVGFDASLPSAGLLVWHVDGGVLAQTRPLNRVNAGPIMGVALEQADGLDQLARTSGGNRGDAGDAWPGSTVARRFDALSQPSSQDNAGRLTRVSLRNISLAADPITVDIAIGVPWLDTTPPLVAILSPAGGEAWTLGAVQTVQWQAHDESGVVAVDLELSRDGGVTYPVRLAQGLANTGLWTGTLGMVPGDATMLRLRARDPEGNEGVATSGLFALVDRFAPGVALSVAITTGQTLEAAQTVAVSWQTGDNVGVVAVDLELSCDGGSSWQPTDLVGLPAVGAASWTVPARACADGRLRAAARDAAGNVGHDQSDPFVIAGGVTSVPDHARLQLGPCVPNPFNPQAEIAFTLPAEGHVSMTVHDAAGRRLATLVDEDRPAGIHRVTWRGRDHRGRDVASGVYWVRASGPGGQALLKITLVR